ncbi:MAG: CheY-like chemotaxis protein [Saprospiraceae bacterium]|mgnify:CR=1 FL=1|jgi:CheY-like chemotaxis protein|tara:strand:+ start:53 stop:448 length:396 start_codon:yes stop_codon:yes gene_type:complete
MKKILVIEDNRSIRENLEELLTLSNYYVITAKNGKLGIEAIQKQLPDLIICDVAMPEVDGYQVLDYVKSKSKTTKIPFVFVTSSAQKGEIEKGVLSGATSYLTKPYHTEDLLETVERLLGYNETDVAIFSK